jgi:hypothetical protein
VLRVQIASYYNYNKYTIGHDILPTTLLKQLSEMEWNGPGKDTLSLASPLYLHAKRRILRDAHDSN